jgi:hypothetical protein
VAWRLPGGTGVPGPHSSERCTILEYWNAIGGIFVSECCIVVSCHTKYCFSWERFC